MSGICSKKSVLFLLILTLVPFLGACGDTDTGKPEQSAILSSGDLVITRSEFEDHLELKMAAYPMNIREMPSEFNNMVMALVKDLTEEMILVRAAREKGIGISEDEYRKAEKNLMQDYPGDSFEDMLLRNAVDYSFWKRRFKRQLLIDKLIRKELVDQIEITSGEVVSYYNQLKPDTGDKEKAGERMSEQELVTWIRNQKARKHYDGWVGELSEKFPVEVNNDNLKSILKSAGKEKG